MAAGCVPRRSRRDGSLLVCVRRVVGRAMEAHRKGAVARVVARVGTGRAARCEVGERGRAAACATGDSEPGALAAEATAVGGTPGHRR